MRKKLPVRARLSPEAEADLNEVLEWSEEHFGRDAALRYAELIIQALSDPEADPNRPGTRQRDELSAALYSYHLSSSRSRVVGSGVKTPRHFIVYRTRSDAVLEVLRILHDSRDMARHLPEE